MFYVWFFYFYSPKLDEIRVSGFGAENTTVAQNTKLDSCFRRDSYW